MKFIFIIIVIIFFIYKFHKKNNFSSKGHYRIADLLFYPEQIIDGGDLSYMLNDYPTSIGVGYMLEQFPCIKTSINNEDCIGLLKQKNENNYINTKMLIDIIKNHEDYKKYSKNFNNNELLLHVRIGDVLCNKDTVFFDSNKTFSQIYSKYGDVEWWNNVIKYIDENKIDTVYLMYGSHTKTCLEESTKYINSIKDMLKNYKIIDINENTADQDLMFSLNSKHFITTGGGYGLLIGEIVKKNGGNFIFTPERTNGDLKNNIYFV